MVLFKMKLMHKEHLACLWYGLDVFDVGQPVGVGGRGGEGVDHLDVERLQERAVSLVLPGRAVRVPVTPAVHHSTIIYTSAVDGDLLEEGRRGRAPPHRKEWGRRSGVKVAAGERSSSNSRGRGSLVWPRLMSAVNIIQSEATH